LLVGRHVFLERRLETPEVPRRMLHPRILKVGRSSRMRKHREVSAAPDLRNAALKRLLDVKPLSATRADETRSDRLKNAAFVSRRDA